jgi:hypothetical protein
MDSQFGYMRGSACAGKTVKAIPNDLQLRARELIDKITV